MKQEARKDTETRMDIKVGSFVAVKAGRQKWYAGLITQVDGDEGDVRFLHRPPGKIRSSVVSNHVHFCQDKYSGTLL